jgi:hypothetical protein
MVGVALIARTGPTYLPGVDRRTLRTQVPDSTMSAVSRCDGVPRLIGESQTGFLRRRPENKKPSPKTGLFVLILWGG